MDNIKKLKVGTGEHSAVKVTEENIADWKKENDTVINALKNSSIPLVKLVVTIAEEIPAALITNENYSYFIFKVAAGEKTIKGVINLRKLPDVEYTPEQCIAEVTKQIGYICNIELEEQVKERLESCASLH